MTRSPETKVAAIEEFQDNFSANENVHSLASDLCARELRRLVDEGTFEILGSDISPVWSILRLLYKCPDAIALVTRHRISFLLQQMLHRATGEVSDALHNHIQFAFTQYHVLISETNEEGMTAGPREAITSRLWDWFNLAIELCATLEKENTNASSPKKEQMNFSRISSLCDCALAAIHLFGDYLVDNMPTAEGHRGIATIPLHVCNSEVVTKLPAILSTSLTESVRAGCHSWCVRISSVGTMPDSVAGDGSVLVCGLVPVALVSNIDDVFGVSYGVDATHSPSAERTVVLESLSSGDTLHFAYECMPGNSSAQLTFSLNGCVLRTIFLHAVPAGGFVPVLHVRKDAPFAAAFIPSVPSFGTSRTIDFIPNTFASPSRTADGRTGLLHKLVAVSTELRRCQLQPAYSEAKTHQFGTAHEQMLRTLQDAMQSDVLKAFYPVPQSGSQHEGEHCALVDINHSGTGDGTATKTIHIPGAAALEVPWFTVRGPLCTVVLQLEHGVEVELGKRNGSEVPRTFFPQLLQSQHPYQCGQMQKQVVRFPGASGVWISFDERSATGSSDDRLTILKGTGTSSTHWGKPYYCGTKNWPGTRGTRALHIPANVFTLNWNPSSKSSGTHSAAHKWGWRCTAVPVVDGAEIAVGTSVVLSTAFCQELEHQPIHEDATAESAAAENPSATPVVFCEGSRSAGSHAKLMGRRGVVVALTAWRGHEDKGVRVKWQGISEIMTHAYGRGIFEVRPLYSLDVLHRHPRSTLVPGNVATVHLTKITMEQVLDKVEKRISTTDDSVCEIEYCVAFAVLLGCD